MAFEQQEVLVVPRRLLVNYDVAFVAWQQVEGQIGALERSFQWHSRSLAENSTKWIQPIPVALLTDKHHHYCVLRRTRNTRDDLKGRLTLVIGGHVERSAGLNGFISLLENTLRNELNEELGVMWDDPPKPLGIVIDPTSIQASRHVAFLFEVRMSGKITVKAPEEFARKSKYNTQFLSVTELESLYGMFDPWSTLILEDYLSPALGYKRARQRFLPI